MIRPVEFIGVEFPDSQFIGEIVPAKKKQLLGI
jgi:hypothetical protein